MKRLLLASLLLGLIPSANAADTCNFVSEYYPDVTIEVINGEYNSVGRGTPKEYQKKGRDKIMFPRFGVGYYYSLSTNDSKTDGRFGGRTTEMNKILGAAEGFFIPSKKCERFIYYGWN